MDLSSLFVPSCYGKGGRSCFQIFLYWQQYETGLPHSTLIFVLSLELLLQHIWNNPDIRGLTTNTYHLKIAAYADDLLFYVSDPLVSLPVLLSEIHAYGVLSDFKIKLQKSESLNITLPSRSIAHLSSNFPFQWAPKAIQ